MSKNKTQTELDTSMFWDFDKTLSYNAIFNFIVGNRGGGKSYGVTEHVVKNFLKHDKQFVYMRRYNSEFERVKEFFDDMRIKFPEINFKIQGGKFYINDKVAGFYWSLNTSDKYKSTPFPHVATLIYDEFLIKNERKSKYLKGEIHSFLDVIETIFRPPLRTPKVFLLGNAFSITNPYFLYFKLEMPKSKKKIYHKNGVLTQLVQNEEYIKKKKESQFYKILAGTDYVKQAVENEFIKDKYDFIAKAPEFTKYLFTIEAKGTQYGVWNAFKQGHWFISTKVDKTCDIVFITTLDDHRPNTMVLKGASQSIYIKYLIDNFRRGLIYFDKIDTYNIVFDAVRGSI